MQAQIEARITQLTQQLEQSLVNHNFMAGSLAELKSFYEFYKTAQSVLPIVESAAKAIEPIVSEVLPSA